MINTKSILFSAALSIATMGLGGTSLTAAAKPTWRKRTTYTKAPRSTPEIEAWNAQVDAKRAAKRAERIAINQANVDRIVDVLNASRGKGDY